MIVKYCSELETNSLAVPTMSRTACMWSILFYSEPHLLIGTLLDGNGSGRGTQGGDGLDTTID